MSFERGERERDLAVARGVAVAEAMAYLDRKCGEAIKRNVSRDRVDDEKVSYSEEVAIEQARWWRAAAERMAEELYSLGALRQPPRSDDPVEAVIGR